MAENVPPGTDSLPLRKRERTNHIISSPCNTLSIKKVLREQNRCNLPVKSKETHVKPTTRPWNVSDDLALVEHFHGDGRLNDQWPGREGKYTNFWKEAAKCVNTKSNHHRTESACYNRVKHEFKGKYPTISEALSKISHGVQTVNSRATQTDLDLDNSPDDVLIATCGEILEKLLKRRSVPMAVRKGSANFIRDTVDGVSNQTKSSQYNVIFGLAKAVAKNTPNNKQVLPFDRLTFQLIAYNVQFVNGGCQSFPICPPAYADWIDTLYTQFGAKFIQIFRGPYYDGIPPDQQYPWNCKLNVACIGIRAIQKRRVQMMKKDNHYFSADTQIQVKALQKVADLNPGGRYWIKSDATDLNSCLQESKTHQWFGDSDIGDGQLQEMHSEYIIRLTKMDEMVKGDGQLRQLMEEELTKLQEDKTLLLTNLSKIQKDYDGKLDKLSTTTNKKMKELCWGIHDHEVVIESIEDAVDTFQSFQRQLDRGKQLNVIAKAVADQTDNHKTLLRNLYRLKRTPATHVMLVSISHEERRRKPYAIPVMYFPYKGITDAKFREKVKDVRDEMTKVGLVPVGSVTDGEFNTCRTIGVDGQATSVFRYIQLAKQKVAHKSDEELLNMLVAKEVVNSKYVAMEPNDIIPQDVLERVSTLHCSGVLLEAILADIRKNLLPTTHQPMMWPCMDPGVSESLHTIVGTYYYRKLLNDEIQNGRDFATHMYIPEFDAVTNTFFHDREDHAHIYKRIGTSTRLGGPTHLDMKALEEVLEDSESGLTAGALKGSDKQSVPQVEQLLSHNVSQSLQKLGFSNEASYFKTLANWHEANDGRAIKSTTATKSSKQLTRCHYNYDMLNMLLDDYMPWHRDVYDFRLVDINRPLKGVCGMTRETVIGVITSLESQEHRRREQHRPAEHPRAGDTNDCELLFSIFREHNSGVAYTLKRFQSTLAPLCSEFLKQLDPDLKFYYETKNQRFASGSLEAEEGCFDTPEDGNPLRLHEVRQKAKDSPAIFIAGRASCPVENSKTARLLFHKRERELPKCQSSVPDHDYPSDLQAPEV